MCPPSVRAEDDGGDTSHWEVFFECTGSRNGQTAPSATFKGITPDYVNGPPPNTGWGNGPAVEPQGSGLSAQIKFPGTRNSASVTVTPILRWVSTTGVAAPNQLSFLLRGHIDASATTTSSSNPLSTSLTGLSHIVSGDPPPAYYGAGSPSTFAKQKDGNRLVTVKLQGGQVRLPSYTGDFSGALNEGNVLMSMAEDHRSVQLSRGVNDAQHPDRERFVLENGEWNTYGDSIYSANNIPSSNTPYLMGDTTPYNLFFPLHIGANRSSEWSDDVTFDWSKSGFAPTPTLTINSVDGNCKVGTPTISRDSIVGTYSYHGSTTGWQKFDISYKVTDHVDDATGTAHYHLTLHDPVEPVEEGETTTVYTISNPMRLGNQVCVWNGGEFGRKADVAETTLKVVTSTESGYDLTATASITPFKDLLGFSAEASYSSTKTVSVDTETKVPAIGVNQMRYLIALHSFQRTHTRFLMFDELGEIRRMMSVDHDGNAISPSIAVYHEAFRDNKFVEDMRWSDNLSNTTRIDSLPSGVTPPLDYDFPSSDLS